MEAFQDANAVAAISIATVAFGFALRLARDYVADKLRQAASLRIVKAYIELAVKNWKDSDMPAGCAEGKSIPNLSLYIDKTLKAAPEEGGGQEPFTPFVPFSPHDNLTVAELRDFLGFLDGRTIQRAVEFVQAEAIRVKRLAKRAP